MKMEKTMAKKEKQEKGNDGLPVEIERLVTPPWCDCKIAFSYDSLDIDRLWNDIKTKELPEGWEFIETDISGCAGYVAIFRVKVIPAHSDGETVSALLIDIAAG
jgi:hypothetical protein